MPLIPHHARFGPEVTYIARRCDQYTLAVSALVVKQLDQSLPDAGILVDLEREAFSPAGRLWIGEELLSIDLQQDVLKEVKSVGQRGRIVDLAELKHIVDAVKHHQTYTK